MSLKNKILTGIIGLEVIFIAGILAFTCYIGSDAVQVTRQMELARQYLQNEEYEQAIAAFEKVIDIDPQNADAYLELAEIYILTDEQDQAVRMLERGTRRTDSEEIQELLDRCVEEPTQGTESETDSKPQQEIPDADMVSDTQGEGQESRQSEQELYQEYLAGTLMSAYGVFDPAQSGTMYSAEDMWFHPAGVMDAMILDFDQDGVPEMLVSYAKQNTGNSSYGVYLEMYEISDGRVVLASSVPFMAYYDGQSGELPGEAAVFSETEWCEMLLNVSAVQVDGIYYIVCEEYRVYGYFADGQSQDYWAMTYQNGSLQYAFSFTQIGGGSSDFEYEGFEFSDGSCIGSEMYYSEDYEYEGLALYDTFESAITAFFEKHGIQIKKNLPHYRNENKESILEKDENNMVDLFAFVNEVKSWDFDTNRVDFEATLTTYGELSKN